ncbi:MAG: bacteriohopanetetrol glucosamine biosynthesis glycosyltransferase HpnI [Syntrophobacteraceae bacterium]
MTILFWFLAVAATIYYLCCMVAAWRFFSAPSPEQPQQWPPLSVLIPLCGVDFRAYDNYRSFCNLDYPDFEIIFGVMDPRDSSVEVIDKLMTDFPEVPIRLVMGSDTIGENPKVNNLHNMLRAAKHEHIVIADSDIRVEKAFLCDIVRHLTQSGVGAVTCLYRAGAAPGLASRLEALGMSAEFAPSVFIAWMTEGVSFALGATVAMTRSQLEAIGGLRAIADYLADDFMLGHLIWKTGAEVRIVPHVVETILGPMKLGELLRHQVRWGRGIRACRQRGHMGLLFTHGTVWALMAMLLEGFSGATVALFGVVFGVRVSMAWYVGCRCLGDRILKRNLPLLFVRDCFNFLVWCLSLAGQRVTWRGKSYILMQDGTIVLGR